MGWNIFELQAMSSPFDCSKYCANVTKDHQSLYCHNPKRSCRMKWVLQTLLEYVPVRVLICSLHYTWHVLKGLKSGKSCFSLYLLLQTEMINFGKLSVILYAKYFRVVLLIIKHISLCVFLIIIWLWWKLKGLHLLLCLVRTCDTHCKWACEWLRFALQWSLKP